MTEAMWKRRPVVASRVGGHQDQIQDGINGVLVDDPRDLAGFGRAVADLLLYQDRAKRLGDAAQQRVRERFLPDRTCHSGSSPAGDAAGEMSDLAAWAGRVFAMTLTTVTRIEGGSAQTSRPARNSAKPVQTPGVEPSRRLQGTVCSAGPGAPTSAAPSSTSRTPPGPSRRGRVRRPTTAVAAAVGDVVQLLRDSPQRAKAAVAQKLFANACLPCTEAARRSSDSAPYGIRFVLSS